MRPLRLRAAGLALAAAFLVSAPAAAHPHGGTPGDPGLGDELFPDLGNGGYDVLHYDVGLRYATADPAQPVTGTVTIAARATQSLSRFNLDFAGDSVGDVRVNGSRARFAHEGEELVVEPKQPLRSGRPFVVQVRDFAATPTTPDPEDFSTTVFFVTPDGTATAGQPDGTHNFLPSNDHPRDKASFTIRFDVPAGTTAVGNGVLIAKRTHKGRTDWTYLQRQPMATELIQLAVGGYDVTPRGRHAGVFVRDVTAPSLTAELDPKLATEIEHIHWMEDRVGEYPFDTYGTLVVDAELGFALETQTLSLFDIGWFRQFDEGVWNPTMVHELAHMWFGDSVAPYEWSDLWLNEGHATWYELLWAEEHGWIDDDTGTDAQTLEDFMRFYYEISNGSRAENGPPGSPTAENLFNNEVYYGGALVLFALREEIGDATFQRLQRAWVRKYRDGVATTADFVALASRVAGRDLGPFLDAWIYGDEVPPMPNHPDWTPEPAAAPAAQAQASALALQRRLELRRR